MTKCENCINDTLCSEFMKNGLFPNSRIETSEPIHKRTAKCACNCKYFRDKSLMINFHCKIGDTVYILIEESEKFGCSYVKEEKVVELSTAGRIWTDSSCYDSDDIGKMLFFTSVGAESALYTMKHKPNQNTEVAEDE